MLRNIKIGDKYGLYTVIEPPFSTPKIGRQVKCQCQCGQIRIVNCGHLHKLTCCKWCSMQSRPLKGHCNPNW